VHYLSAAAATLVQTVPSGINFYNAPTGTANATATLSAMAQIVAPGNLILNGNYLTFVNAAATGVNGGGGPFIYGDASSIIAHLGSGNVQFAVQNYSGTTILLAAGGAGGANVAIGPPGVTNYLYFDTQLTTASPRITGGLGYLNFQLGSSNQSYIFYNNAGTAIAAFDAPGGCRNASGTWAAFSDERLKRNVNAYTRGLDAIKQLEPIYFQYNELMGSLGDDQWHYGFSAQQVEPIMPELCGESIIHRPLDADPAQNGDPGATYMTVDPTRSIFAVINALKEIDARLAALEDAR
jgi:hypothetical protein